MNSPGLGVTKLCFLSALMQDGSSESHRAVDLEWWDELGMGVRAALPWRWLPTFGHTRLFTEGTQLFL